MPQAVVNISDKANRILNIVKAKYDLKDKSQAIEKIAMEYEQEILEPELKPEFVESVKKAQYGRLRKAHYQRDAIFDFLENPVRSKKFITSKSIKNSINKMWSR